MVGRFSRRAAVVVLALLIGASAQAGERVVMPYVCTPLGGAVELDPSEPRSYDIVGPHDQDTFTHCSPVNPDRCKTWRVHRFDIDCNGSRVPWYKIVAAASELNDGPAFESGGRLSIRMRPMRPMAGGQRWRRDGPWDGQGGPDGFRQFDRTPYGRGDVASLPPGFAPVVAMSAKFFGSSPGGDDAEYGGEATAKPNAPAGTLPKTALPVPAVAKPAPPKPAERPQAAADAAPAKPASEKPAAPSLKTAAVAVAPAAQGAAPAPTSTPSGMTILNTPPPAPQTAAVADPAVPTPKPASPPAADKKPTVTAVDLNDPASDKSEISVSLASPEGSSQRKQDSILGSTLGQAIAGFVAIAGLTAMMIFISRRQERVPAAAGGMHDLGNVRLDGFGGRERPSEPYFASPSSKALVPSPPSRPQAEVISPPEIPPVAPQPGTLSAALEMYAATDWLPATRADAIQVLGASPEASSEAIRKIVDGLRQSWHPDLARDEADRLIREQRMKLINVAWDIIQHA